MTALCLESLLTCPVCCHAETLTMPTDACQWFYESPSCKSLIKPKTGDCCVFCTYGNAPCPPIQKAQATGTRRCCN
jgi:hypothetical protein